MQQELQQQHQQEQHALYSADWLDADGNFLPNPLTTTPYPAVSSGMTFGQGQGYSQGQRYGQDQSG